MALPSIKPYAMPTHTPANRVDWQPDASRAVLLVHDMQRYFLDAFTADASPLLELMANVGALREQCTNLGIPVIFSAQPPAQRPDQRGLLLDFWGKGIPGPDEAEIARQLRPRDDERLLTKWRYSAFQLTDLAQLMAELGRDQLIICGVYAHIGVLMTAGEAFQRDIQAFVVADAVADFSREHHEMALSYAAERCAVTMTTTQLSRAVAKATPLPQSGSADWDIPLVSLAQDRVATLGTRA
ncbi:isochorismatase family protein [Nonomuraea dietziae]|uniref:Bifunctional isochorismate lyase/aryl carrier protein n=1 Tax=Nonomuraea dietziae TaxID=65515 RepID=A0A7W5V2E5_9ACTN|nr:isochorismatase family protein [Nonomuraea dietziae]MBB3724444.1 bifunctional isochorismate lyase/aryl carrier protein [Nonomuraea dietziae]